MEPGSEVSSYLIKLIFSPNQILPIPDMEKESNMRLEDLIKSGVLMKDIHEQVSFTSNLAIRFYFNEILARFSEDFNGSIHEFVIRSLGSMLRSILLRSANELFSNGRILPKIFFQALLISASKDCCIYPKVYDIATNEDKVKWSKNNQGIDIYIWGKLRWVLEILVEGKRINQKSEHLAINEKYPHRGLSDYLIVDFREGLNDSVARDQNRITVFLDKSSLSSCNCVIGLIQEKVKINFSE
jgi:hypothetical protein